MDPIRVLISRATRRLGVGLAARYAALALLAVAAAECLLIVLDRLFFLGTIAGTRFVSAPVLAALAAAGLAAAAVFAYRRWPRADATAIEIDDRLRLAERISSALAVGGLDQPMARAVVADARSYAKNVPLSQAFPFRFRREYGGLLGAAALAAGLAAWMPQYDLLARKQRTDEVRKEQDSVRKEAEAMRRDLAQLRKTVTLQHPERLEQYLDKTEEVIKEMEEGKLTRADAMAKLNDLQDVLKEAQKGLAQNALVPPAVAQKEGIDKAKELAKALARNDLAAAKAQLQKLAGEEAVKNLSQNDLKKLQRELQNLAKALEENKACNQPGATSKPSAQQCQSDQDAQQLADALKNLAQSLEEGDPKACEQAMSECQSELDKRAQLESELALLKQCEGLSREGQAGLCQKPGEGEGGQNSGIYTQGEENREKVGPGMGGPGIGRGGKAPEAEEEVKFNPVKPPSQITDGRKTLSFFVDGKQVKGEAKVEFSKEVDAARTEAAQALQDEKIPRAYEEYVREYFQGMKGQ